MRGFDATDGLALIEPEGAHLLRELGWRKPILLLEGCFDAADTELAARLQLDLTIHCEEQLVLFERNDEQFEGQARNVLLLDRGDQPNAMGRIDDVLTRLESKPLRDLLGNHRQYS